jgi:hypothetical protein
MAWFAAAATLFPSESSLTGFAVVERFGDGPLLCGKLSVCRINSLPYV